MIKCKLLKRVAVETKKKTRWSEVANVEAEVEAGAPATSGTGLVRPEAGIVPASPIIPSLITFRPYQKEAFENRTSGIEIWLWGRQTGKSFTLASWAVDRLLTIPGRTVTVISNSRRNGIELNQKCAEICRLLREAFESVDLSVDDRFENLRAETRITIKGKTGRILIIAPNINTLRGFSGDLILDEFAFHEDSGKIWEEARPTLDTHRDLLCRIASTPNGRHNQFYRMVTDPLFKVRKVTRTDAYHQGVMIYHPQTREPITPEEARALDQNKRAYDQNYECSFEDENMALLTYDLISSAERANVGFICSQNWSAAALAFLKSPLDQTPPVEGAVGKDLCPPAQSVDRFSGKKSLREWLATAKTEAEQTRLIRHISSHVCNGSADRLEILMQNDFAISLTEKFAPYYAYNAFKQKRTPPESARRLYAGIDVGRNNDQTVITVIERDADLYFVRAILRLSEMRLPDQQLRIEQLLQIPELRHAKIDMTGIGLGLFEYTQRKFPKKITGVNFASSVSLNSPSPHRGEGRGEVVSHPSHSSVRITEYLATQLLSLYESHAIQHPIDATLREDLRKPERYISTTGRVSIAATRTDTGHADHFWSLALAINAAQTAENKPLQWTAIDSKYRQRRTFI